MKTKYILCAFALSALFGIDSQAQTATVSGKAGKYSYVDLGLKSGLKWATCNVGANKPELNGETFSWGGIEQDTTPPQDILLWHKYRFYAGRITPSDESDPYYAWGDTTYNAENQIMYYSWLTKYCTNSKIGTNDGLTMLQAEDDAATTKMGGDWRMPTAEEMQELIAGCNWKKVDNYNKTNIDGWLGTSKQNKNTIFLPFQHRNYGGTYYWTASLDTADCKKSKIGVFSDNVELYEWNRSAPYYVRAVYGKRKVQAQLKIRYEKKVTISGQAGKYNYVDLGLKSGTKWATCNVGAKNAEDFGGYYSWGETKIKKDYQWENYKFFKGIFISKKYDFGEFNTYNWYGKDFPDTVASMVTKYNAEKDKLSKLQPTDDAATANWGKEWCMPTKEQLQELVKGCIWEYTENYNNTHVAGYIGTSKTNGNVIFMPATGTKNKKLLALYEQRYLYEKIDYSGEIDSNYWSANVDATECIKAYSFSFNYNNFENVHFWADNEIERYTAASVRAVVKK